MTAAGQFLSDLNALHPFREEQRPHPTRLPPTPRNQCGWQLAWARIDRVENNVASARAMSDRNAFGPLLDRIVLAADQALPADAVTLRHEPVPAHGEPDPSETAARLAGEAFPDGPKPGPAPRKEERPNQARTVDGPYRTR